MKKAVLIILAVMMVICVASAWAEETDKTYDVLYLQIQNVVGDTDLDITDIGVKKLTDNQASFMFQGSDWSVMGEADMETGIVTHITCRVSNNRPGRMLAMAICYIISGEEDTSTFIDKYIVNGCIGTPDFPEYTTIVSVEEGTEFIYTFARTAGTELHNTENGFSMASMIETIELYTEQEEVRTIE